MKITINSPTRVDLAGGTLDCWPLYLLIGDCQTVNLSLSIYTHVELVPRTDKRIFLNIRDLNYQRDFVNLNEMLACSDEQLGLVRAHLSFWQPTQGLDLTTFSESPVGGGLGGSSSLCISLIKAFAQWQGKNLGLDEMVTLAGNLEAQILKKPTGTQDYFPAAQPGLNVIHYGPRGPISELLPFDEELFRQRMILIYTGRSHHSGINNWQVLKSAIEGDTQTLAVLKNLAQISREMTELCRKHRWQDLPNLFQRETNERLRLSPGFSSPEILALEKLARSKGAEAIKICGAGGGGCVIVWSDPELRGAIEDACQKQGFQPLKAAPVVGR